MSSALSQIPEAVTAASILLTVYCVGRRGRGGSRPQSGPNGGRSGRRNFHSKAMRRIPRNAFRKPKHL